MLVGDNKDVIYELMDRSGDIPNGCFIIHYSWLCSQYIVMLVMLWDTMWPI